MFNETITCYPNCSVRDCLNCAHSFSDEQDRLHCELNDYKIVDDDYSCEEWN